MRDVQLEPIVASRCNQGGMQSDAMVLPFVLVQLL